MSYCWAAYGKIPDLPEGYQHFTVNHSENFVGPLTNANTQKAESKWQKFKHRHKSEYGTARTLLAEYVAQVKTYP
uniref:Uncharacterized protein n=1 Tax=Panagrolaimus davidi TaxID=227884 RepID=A0A914PPR3_9BILA